MRSKGKIAANPRRPNVQKAALSKMGAQLANAGRVFNSMALDATTWMNARKTTEAVSTSVQISPARFCARADRVSLWQKMENRAWMTTNVLSIMGTDLVKIFAPTPQEVTSAPVNLPFSPSWLPMDILVKAAMIAPSIMGVALTNA